MPLDLSQVDFESLDSANEDKDLLRSNLQQASSINPDEHAKKRQLSEKTGVPAFAVDESVETQFNLDNVDFESLTKQSPVTARHLSNFDNAIIAQDDIDVMQVIEENLKPVKKYTKDISIAFEKGQLQVEASDIGLSRMYQALGANEVITDEQIARVKEIEDLLKPDDSDYGFLAGAPIAASQQLPIMYEIFRTGLGYAAGGAATGAATGAAVGSVAGGVGAIPGAIAGAVPGAKIGGRIGVAKAAFDLEAGSAFNEFITLRDEPRGTGVLGTEGRMINPQIAAGAAAIVGAVNASLEFISLAALGRTVTPAMRLMIKSKVKKSLATETGRQMIARLMKDYGIAVGTETVTESAQEFTNVIGAELAKYVDKESFTEQDLSKAIDNILFSEQTAERVVEAGKVGAQAALIFGGAGSTVSVITETKERQRLSENEQLRIDALNENVGKAKFKERDRASFRQFVEQADGDNNTHVFIDGSQVALYLQDKTPEQIESDPALKLLNDQRNEAATLGTDVQIPVADFAADIAGTEHFDNLRESMTMSEQSTSPFRQEQDRQETETYIQTLMAEAQENASEYVEAQDIYEQVRSQLIDTGAVSPANASIMAQVVPAWATAQARRQGKTVAQVYQDAGLTIEGPVTGERARLEAEKGAMEQVAVPTAVAIDPAQAWTEHHEAQAQMRGLTPEQAAAVAPEPDTDPLTGLYTDTELLPALDRAKVAEPSVYVESDLFNLGGMNKALGANVRADTVLKQIAAAYESAFQGVPVFRRGAGRMSAIVPQGFDVNQALIQVNQEVARIAKENNLENIPAPKVAGQKGIGLYSGVSNIETGATTNEIIGGAQEQINAAMPQGEQDVNREQTFQAWAESSSGRPEGIAARVAEQARGAEAADSRIQGQALERAGADPAAVISEGDRAFATPAQVRRAQFEERAAGAGLTVGQAEPFRPITRKDPLTGWFTDRDRIPTIERAQQYVDETGGDAVYVVADISNLGGLNLALGENLADIVFRNMAQIVGERAAAIPGAESVPFRHGGDEISFVITGADEVAVQQAMDQAAAEVAGYIEAIGLQDLPHAKEPTNKARAGSGVYIGIQDVGTTAADINDVVDAADAMVELGKTQPKVESVPVQVRGEAGEQFAQPQAAPVELKGEGDVALVETGKPVSFWFVHNTESATKIFGKPKKDSPYGRGYEPSARYVSVVSKETADRAEGTVIGGKLTFRNPLVVPNDNLKWKEKLSKRYGGKTGKKLSLALIADGYDGIITTEEKYITETVDLTTFDEAKALYQPSPTKQPRGYYEPANSIIRLTEAADLSTFLHEFAHFMYEMEVNGNTELLQSINRWYKRNAKDVAKEANSYLNDKFDAEKQLEQPTALDMSKEARLKRAEAMGFDTSTVYYHGTDSRGIKEFEVGRETKRYTTFTEQVVVSQGVFLSPSEEDAGSYGENVGSYYVRIRNKLVDPASIVTSSKDSDEKKRKAEKIWDDIDYILEPAMYTEGGVNYIDTDGGMSRTEVDDEGRWVEQAFGEGLIDWDYLDNPDVVSRLIERGYDAVSVYEPNDVSGESLFIPDPKNIRSTDAAFAESDTADILAQPQQPPTGKAGTITEADVVAFLDQTTTGDKDKDAAIRRAVHEQFARGFEAYLMEGKAPSIELRNAFRTFARWLARIYQSVRGQLKVNLDDEMRQVFDRLLATDEQIAAAEARARVEPMFTDAAMGGMTDEEFAAYQKRQEKVKDVQAETLRDKLIQQLTRQTKTWWKEEKQDIIDDEMGTLSRQQVHVARARLRDGDMKLDHATVKEMAGEAKTDKRGRTFVVIPPKLIGMTAKGQQGVHPDEAAAFFGYRSGAEMLNDLATAPSIKEEAEVNAEAQMIERHGDILTDGTIEKEADEAVQNEERGKLILAELKALSKGTKIPTIDRVTIKDIAEERIGRLAFREIHPGKYRKAEIKAAQEAARMLAEGNREGAAQAKMRQVMNYYLGMSANNAKNDTMKIVDRMNRYSKKKVREEIMKAEGGYWDQIAKILNRFEFRKSATLKEVESLNTWMKERMEVDGDGLVLSNAVLNESYVTHWKNVPFSDLQGINDSVKNIEHVARYANKLTRMQEEITFNNLVERMVTSAEEKVKTRFKSKRTDVAEGKNWGRWLMAQMTKIPFLTSWMDGGERAGLWHQALVQPFTDAYNAEIKLWEKAGKPVMDMIANRSKDDIKRHNRKVYIKEIDDNLYGHQILAVALNTGNQSNLKKLLLGEGWADPENEAEISFDNPKLQAVLSRMTKDDWKLVQSIWDQMETLYPELAEVHRRTTGLTPPKIEAAPVKTKFGTFKGGYYPVKYDPNRDFKAALNEDKLNAEVESMFSNGASIQASVNAGATNERTGYYAPIRLSLDVVPSHFQETIHYITHHDAVREVNRLIRNKRIATVMKEKLGPEEYAQMKPWLNDIAKDGREAPTKMFWDDMLQRLRFGVTLGAMGFKASTGLIQISGLSNTIAETGLGPVMQSMRSILGSTTTMKQAWDFAVENSNVLEHRAQTMDREIKNAMSKLTSESNIKTGNWAKDFMKKIDNIPMLKAAQEVSMKHIALIQTYMVDLPSWHAAYIKGMKEWGDEARSFQYADWVIENVQGSGATKDLARIMRGQTETGRMFTMFMTFFSSLWNMERDLVKGAQSGRYSTTSVAAKAMFLFTLPVLFEMMMRGELGEPDDEDDRLQQMLLGVAMYPIQSVPFVRDAANATTGEFGYNISPLQSIIEQGTRTIPKIVTRGFTDEEITKGQVKGATKFIGAAVGIPGTGQAWATGEHLYNVIEDGEEFTMQELLFGPKRD